MKLLWSKPVPTDNPWEPYYAGIFCKIADKVHYIFKEGRGIGVLAEDCDAIQNFCAEDKLIPLPNHWILSESEDHANLFFNEGLLLEIPDMKIREIADTALAEEYRNRCKPEKYYVEASFCHEGYCISHKGNFGYRCTKDGEVLWEFRGQGYLYTDICFREDRVFFGTAGQGGYFYVVNLKTGEALANIKTGGTASLVAADDRCYVLANGKTAKLLCVDIQNGAIRSEAELPGKASVYSRLGLIDGRLHAITFSYKKDCLHRAIWNCVTF